MSQNSLQQTDHFDDYNPSQNQSTNSTDTVILTSPPSPSAIRHQLEANSKAFNTMRTAPVDSGFHHDKKSDFCEDKFFHGKTACVTGAGRGIGRAVALRLAQLGCVKVVAVGRTEDYLLDLATEHKNIIPVPVDVRDWEATKDAIKPHLPVQLLVNNAGVLILNAFHDIRREDFDESFQTNVRPIISLSQVVSQDLIERNMPGSIVNVSSIASVIAAEKFMVYCGTKACMDAFTRNMAGELGRHQVRVNSVQPTVVLTDMGKAAGWENEEQSRPLLSKTPLGRFAEINEVVEPIIFLLSGKSSMITGVCLPVDGGYLAT